MPKPIQRQHLAYYLLNENNMIQMITLSI